jgi:hypothetical protein
MDILSGCLSHQINLECQKMLCKKAVLIQFAVIFYSSLVQANVEFVGEVKTSNSDYQSGYHDGQLPPAIGVHNYQVLRANRSHPELSDGLGWTYNHGPNLAYWNNTFYLHYLNNPTGEHIPPGSTMLTTSKNGVTWSQPRIIFPVYFVSDERANITFYYMHQRMGFHSASNGRLLVMGFYGSHDGSGIGRVVREVYADNSFGPIYFIKANDAWKGELKYPLYTDSADEGFVEACNEFMQDRIKRLQWWEEDRLAEDASSLYSVPKIDDDGELKPAQAFSYYRLANNDVVGFFKHRLVSVSEDEGLSWSKPQRVESLTYGGAKVWAQKLHNGQYALAYNPTDGWARHPLSITTSSDGLRYDTLLNIHSEVPPKRYWGREKRPGPQYVRGIIEGNGKPPGDDLWLTYSVNKEDLWVARIPIPVDGVGPDVVRDDFREMPTGAYVKNWNIYSPVWSPVRIEAAKGGNVLMLQDQDPYDYAKAVRVFKSRESGSVKLDVLPKQQSDKFAIELVGRNGKRAIQLQISRSGELSAKDGSRGNRELASLEHNAWHQILIEYDSSKLSYSVAINGNEISTPIDFSAETIPERLILRTGDYRMEDDVIEHKSGDKYAPGWDEPNSEQKSETSTYYIRSVFIN